MTAKYKGVGFGTECCDHMSIVKQTSLVVYCESIATVVYNCSVRLLVVYYSKCLN